MGSPLSASTQQRVFAIAIAVVVAVAGAAIILLDPRLPQGFRESVSALLFVLVGVLVAGSCAYRARQSTGRRRHSWRLFLVATLVALIGNVSGALSGQLAVTDGGVVVALLLTIAGLAAFPGVRRRGAGQVMALIDGLAAGVGVLAIVSVLVYPQLLHPGQVSAATFMGAIVIPVLDVLLVTVAIVLLLRAGGPDRRSLILIALGFVIYAGTDLAYAVQVAQDSFEWGSRLDLGWIIGYLVVMLAALTPSLPADRDATRPPSDTRGALLVFAVLLVAGSVQSLSPEQLTTPVAVLWLLLVLLAGTRQTILSAVNDSLRHGLERRVDEQTADLHRLAAQNALLLTSVGDGIYGVDPQGQITFVNPSAAEAVGLRTRDLLGRDAHETLHAGQGEHTADDCYVMLAALSGEMVSQIDDTYRRVGGEPFPVEVTASPVVDPDDGQPRGAVVVFRDITERRDVERMKSEFLSVVSHELRTPLTAIRGTLGLLAGGAVGELSPRVEAMVTVASESSERLTRLINDLLDMERIGSGGSEMELTEADAGDLVRAAAQEMRGAGVERDITLEVGPCGGRVLGDEDQIMQTLSNLLGNAIKFSDPGGVVVVSAHAADGHVVFRVRDEGRGIPSSKLALIFEPFAQVDSSDAREKGGTGLGLAICRAIVERHGGRIWAESRAGAGTTMLFTLPASEPASTRRLQEVGG